MKRFFHRGLFLEVFRQLRTAGIVAACILMLFNVGTLFNTFTGMITAHLPIIPADASSAVYMMMFIYIASLVLTFIAFNWLNHRFMSDFYHALPIKRVQVYWSAFAAVALWILIGVTGYAIVHTLLYLITGMPFNYLSYLCVYLNMLIGIIHVVGIVALACALSGTRFVNLFSAAVILLLPRALLLVLAGFTAMEANYLPVLKLSFLFDPSYNIFGTPYMSIFGGAFSAITSTGSESIVSFTNPAAMVYSFLYACLLAFMGMLVFRHRPSEAAGMPMRNRVIQGTVRTAFGLPLLLIVVLLYKAEQFAVSAAVILVLFSFAFYCLYELISTKSAKHMVRSMPLFSVCIGIAVLYLFIPKLIAKGTASVTLQPDEIRTVELVNSDAFNPSNDTYETLCAEAVRMDSPDACKIVANAYQRSVNLSREAREALGIEFSNTVTVRIRRSSGATMLRSLQLTKPEYEALKKIKEQDPVYREKMSRFPDGYHYYQAYGLTAAQAREIGELYREEFAQIGAEKANDETYPSRIFYRLDVQGVCGTNAYSVHYVITDLTPKTAQRYTELLYQAYNEHSKDPIRNALKWMESDYEYTDLSDMQLGNLLSISPSQAYYFSEEILQSMKTQKMPSEVIPEFKEVFEILLEAEPTNNANEGVTLSMQQSYQPDLFMITEYASSTRQYMTLKLTEEQIARIHELIDKYNIDDMKTYAMEID